jgi:peptidoglycan/LPS O-acetylase OafA/YrhL
LTSITGIEPTTTEPGSDIAALAAFPATSVTGRTQSGRAIYFPALDGLRALAAIAVLLYHAGVPWFRGGLLGVDVFFVLSGFLITWLLLGEQARQGTIGLVGFWRRRARRLLPMLIVVGSAVLVYAEFFGNPDQLPQTRVDLAATLGYVANWRFAFSHQSYFDTFNAPSPLLHTWSLGVEEQFYLLWPLVVLLLSAAMRRRGPAAAARVLFALSSAGAIASASVAYLLARHGADASRVYYGTDTRSEALLVGAALACWFVLRARRTGDGPVPADGTSPSSGPPVVGYSPFRGVWPVRFLGVAGAAGVLWFWVFTRGESSLLHQGGFLLVALAGGALILNVVVQPSAVIARFLSLPPLRYLGRISYGTYLWHWPVFLVLNGAHTGLTGPALVAVRIGAATLISALTSAAVAYALATVPRRRWQFRLAVPTAVAAIAALLVTGLAQPTHLDELGALEQQGQASTPPAARSAGPIRTMVVGDSVAVTLGGGLTKLQGSYGIDIGNHGWTGCGIARGSESSDGEHEYPAFPDCMRWPAQWARWRDDYKPDVGLIVIGRWEVVDRKVDGRWTNIGDPSFQGYLAGELDTAIDVLAAKGAKVEIVTSPVFHGHELSDGTSSAVNQAWRVKILNRLIREAVARHPFVAHLYDLEAVLTPGDVYRQKLDGEDLRFDDGIHISAFGAAVAAPTLMPELAWLGNLSRDDLGKAMSSKSRQAQGAPAPTSGSSGSGSPPTAAGSAPTTRGLADKS